MFNTQLVNQKSPVMIDGLEFTSYQNFLFQGRDVNTVLLNILLNSMKTQSMIGLHEAVYDNGKLRLKNGADSKPIQVAVSSNERQVVFISDSFLSFTRQYINWNTVGMVERNGKVLWRSPLLIDDNYNSRIKTDNLMNLFVGNEEKPYSNLTEFKNWLSDGDRCLRVVDWNGFRNRKGLFLKVDKVIRSKGFHVSIYYRNKKLAEDFIGFLPASQYVFGSGGLLSTFSGSNREGFLYALEPLVNSR